MPEAKVEPVQLDGGPGFPTVLCFTVTCASFVLHDVGSPLVSVVER